MGAEPVWGTLAWELVEAELELELLELVLLEVLELLEPEPLDWALLVWDELDDVEVPPTPPPSDVDDELEELSVLDEEVEESVLLDEEVEESLLLDEELDELLLDDELEEPATQKVLSLIFGPPSSTNVR